MSTPLFITARTAEGLHIGALNIRCSVLRASDRYEWDFDDDSFQAAGSATTPKEAALEDSDAEVYYPDIDYSGWQDGRYLLRAQEATQPIAGVEEFQVFDGLLLGEQYPWLVQIEHSSDSSNDYYRVWLTKNGNPITSGYTGASVLTLNVFDATGTTTVSQTKDTSDATADGSFYVTTATQVSLGTVYQAKATLVNSGTTYTETKPVEK